MGTFEAGLDSVVFLMQNSILEEFSELIKKPFNLPPIHNSSSFEGIDLIAQEVDYKVGVFVFFFINFIVFFFSFSLRYNLSLE